MNDLANDCASMAGSLEQAAKALRRASKDSVVPGCVWLVQDKLHNAVRGVYGSKAAAEAALSRLALGGVGYLEINRHTVKS